MNTLVIVTTVLFLAITAFLGWVGYKQTKSSKDFLIAGGGVHPVIMAISYGSTFISTSAIVGFGGAASKFGLGILWLTFLNILMGIFIAFVLFGKRTRSMGHYLDAHTFPELIGKRFDSKFLQVASGVVILVGMPLYAAAVMLGGMSFLTVALGMSRELALGIVVVLVAAYVMMGGMKGVMYTDAFQGGIMALGMILLLVFTYSAFGGVVPAHQALTDLSSQVPQALKDQGSQGWTSMPAAGSPLWFQLITTVVMGVGIGVLAQPQLAVRFMTVKSDRELNRGVAIGGVFILLMTGTAFIVGALSNIWFLQNTGKYAIEATGSPDNVIPAFIKAVMPEWYTAIFMVTLLAAALSTLSSQFHTMGSAFGHDILEKGVGIKAKKPVRVVRVAMLVSVLAATAVAWFLPGFFKTGSTIIVNSTSLFFGLCAGAFLSIYALGLFWKGMTKSGAIAGFVSGLSVSVFMLIFVHAKVSGPLGLAQLICGTPSIAGTSPLKDIDPLIFAVPVSAVFSIAVSLATSKLPSHHIAGLFAKGKPAQEQA